MSPSRLALASFTVALALASFACKKSDPEGPAPQGSSSTAPSSAPSAAAASSASASEAGAPSANAAGTASSFSGKYTTEAVTAIAVPEGTKWKGEEGTEGTGEGTLTLASAADGRVTGTVEGPLGPALVEGLLEGDSLTATFRRKDPTDGGFYGTILGKVTGDKVEGSIAASRANAGLVRTGKLTLSKK
jgi:hypothetical protein